MPTEVVDTCDGWELCRTGVGTVTVVGVQPVVKARARPSFEVLGRTERAILRRVAARSAAPRVWGERMCYGSRDRRGIQSRWRSGWDGHQTDLGKGLIGGADARAVLSVVAAPTLKAPARINPTPIEKAATKPTANSTAAVATSSLRRPREGCNQVAEAVVAMVAANVARTQVGAPRSPSHAEVGGSPSPLACCWRSNA
jgi:hypothetical protein